MEKLTTDLPATNRIDVIDALRGIVLIGICMIHAMQHFGGPLPGPSGTQAPWLDTMNQLTGWIVTHFVAGKFFIIFSFLFGLSFFIQMDRASQKGIDFRGRFLWRLAVLFLIGLIHSALFRLDILIIYAMLGVPLVLMYRLPNRVLTVIAAFLLLGGVQFATTVYHTVSGPPAQESAESLADRRQQTRELALDGSLAQNVEHNIRAGLPAKFGFQFGEYGRGYITMGIFILGLLAGRLRLFQNPGLHRRVFARGGWLALGAILLLYILQPHLSRGDTGSLTAWTWMLVANAINVLTAFVWVAFVVWAYRKEAVSRALTRVVAYGRMGLTNYMVQSVTGVLLFYGFGLGLYGLGIFYSVLIGLAYTILQVQISYYWLGRYRFGPVEWLWRSATYLRWQPLRKSTGRVLAG